MRDVTRWVLLCLVATLTLAEPALARLPRKYFPKESAIGHFGDGPGEFRSPTAVALAADSSLWITDAKNNSVAHYDSEGRYIGSVEPGKDPLNVPWGVAVTSKGEVLVVEERGCQVRRFSSRGQLLGVFGGVGSDTGKFRSPRSIAIDRRGHIFVADSANFRIQEFDAGYNWVRNWRSKDERGRAFSPWGVAIDPQDRLWGVYPNVSRVTRFDADGKEIVTFGERGASLGQLSQPEALAFDVRGNVFVSDSGNHRIQRFTSDGIFTYTFGARGSGHGQFKTPQGIAIDVAGNITVADSENFRVQVLLIDPFYAARNRAWAAQESGDINAAFDGWRQVLDRQPLDREAADHFVAIAMALATKDKDSPHLDHARPYLEAILKINPSNLEARKFLRWILWKQNKGWIYYVTLGTGIILTLVFLLGTMIRMVLSD